MHDRRAAAFSVELPGPVWIDADRAAHPAYDGMAIAVWRKNEYSVTWISVASSTDWLSKMRAQLGDDHKVTDGFEDEYWLRSATAAQLRLKLVAGDNGFGYILSVTPGGRSERASHVRLVRGAREPEVLTRHRRVRSSPSRRRCAWARAHGGAAPAARAR